MQEKKNSPMSIVVQVYCFNLQQRYTIRCINMNDNRCIFGFIHNEISYHAQGDELNNPLASLNTLGVDREVSMISQGYEHL